METSGPTATGDKHRVGDSSLLITLPAPDPRGDSTEDGTDGYGTDKCLDPHDVEAVAADNGKLLAPTLQDAPAILAGIEGGGDTTLAPDTGGDTEVLPGGDVVRTDDRAGVGAAPMA